MRSKAVLLHFIFQYLNWKWSQFYSRINYIIKNNYRRECAGFLQVRPWMQWDDHGWFSSSGLGLFGHHWVADTYLRGVPPIPIEPRSPALQVDSLPAKPQGKLENIGMGSLPLPQWSFLTQESNQGLLHCRQILNQLSYPGSIFNPYICIYIYTHTHTHTHTVCV